MPVCSLAQRPALQSCHAPSSEPVSVSAPALQALRRAPAAVNAQALPAQNTRLGKVDSIAATPCAVRLNEAELAQRILRALRSGCPLDRAHPRELLALDRALAAWRACPDSAQVRALYRCLDQLPPQPTRGVYPENYQALLQARAQLRVDPGPQHAQNLSRALSALAPQPPYYPAVHHPELDEAMSLWRDAPGSRHARSLARALQALPAPPADAAPALHELHALLQPLALRMLSQDMLQQRERIKQQWLTEYEQGVAAHSGNRNDYQLQGSLGGKLAGQSLSLAPQRSVALLMSDSEKPETEQQLALGLELKLGLKAAGVKAFEVSGALSGALKFKQQFDTVEQLVERQLQTPQRNPLRAREPTLRPALQASLAEADLIGKLQQLRLLTPEEMISPLSLPVNTLPKTSCARELGLGAALATQLAAFKGKATVRASRASVSTIKFKSLMSVAMEHPQALPPAIRDSARFHLQAWQADPHLERGGFFSLPFRLPGNNDIKKQQMLIQMLDAGHQELLQYQQLIARYKQPALKPQERESLRQQKTDWENQRGVRGRAAMLQSMVVSHAALAQAYKTLTEANPADAGIDARMQGMSHDYLNARLGLDPQQMATTLSLPAVSQGAMTKLEGKLNLQLPGLAQLEAAIKFSHSTQHYNPNLDGALLEIVLSGDAQLGSETVQIALQQALQSTLSNWLAPLGLAGADFDLALPLNTSLQGSLGLGVQFSLVKHPNDPEYQLLHVRKLARSGMTVGATLPVDGVKLSLTAAALQTRVMSEHWGTQSLRPFLHKFNALKGNASIPAAEKQANWEARLRAHRSELSAMLGHLAPPAPEAPRTQGALQSQLQRMAQQLGANGEALQQELLAAARGLRAAADSEPAFERARLALTALFEAHYSAIYTKDAAARFHMAH